MSEEKKISKKTLKIILGVCVGAVVALVVGFFAYIHVADTNTLGRKITIYGLDVSKLGVEDAKQKILTTFQDKKIVFKENGADVYSLTLKDAAYRTSEEERGKPQDLCRTGECKYLLQSQQGCRAGKECTDSRPFW